MHGEAETFRSEVETGSESVWWGDRAKYLRGSSGGKDAIIVGVRRRINALALGVAIYGFAAWIYVAAVALVEPNTLSLQLTHLASWPRTDTFGEASFVASFVAFLVYRLTR